MKKILLLLTLVGFLTVGCQTDTPTDVTLDQEGVALSVSLAQSRVTLGEKAGEKYPVYWSEGDKLVVNGVISNEAVIDTEDRAKAVFTFSNGVISHPYRVTYPYCEATTAEQSIVEFPAEQSYTEGSFSAESAPMCGYIATESANITLNHLASILRFSIKSALDNVVLDKVVITSTSGAKLSGEFAVDCQNVTLSATDKTSNVVTYNLPSNFALSTTAEKVLYISLPAVEVGDCTIEFVDNSGKKMTATWTPNAPLSKGVVREFKTITYQPKNSISLPTFDSVDGDLMFYFKKYAGDDEIKVMSFNVRTKTSETDPANNWDNRKEACVALIRDQKPSIIGYQEAQYTLQWSYLKEQLASQYDGYGVNRDDGTESGRGEVMGIMYNKATIEKLDGGTFWLSETPDTPSMGFGASYCRNATWGLFKHIPSGKTFYYINTHLDHQVATAQVEGMKLISKSFEKYKDQYPLFLTGDMNITADNVAMDVIEGYMHNARNAAPTSLTDFSTTYNAYKTTKNSIIDHIYCSDYLRVVEYHTINEKYGNVNFVSDHYPIYAIIELP